MLRIPSRSDSRFVLFLCSTALLVTAFAFFATYGGLKELRARDVWRAEAHSKDLTKAIRQSTTNYLEKVEISLNTIAYVIEKDNHIGKREKEQIENLLSNQFLIFRDNENISITNEKGEIIFHEGLNTPLNFSVSDRDYFISLKNGTKTGLVASPVLISRLSKKPVIIFSRSYTKADGTFGGIVAMPVPTDRFQHLVSGYTLGGRDRLSLFSEDRSLIVSTEPTTI
ncbi:PDC sensor domain-containing protein, partial [Rhodospirillum rubrum]